MPDTHNDSHYGWKNNPKWLFDAYRHIADGKSSWSDPWKLQDFLDSMLDERLLDPKEIPYNPWIKEYGTGPNKAMGAFHPLIEALTAEAVEVMNVFGSDYAFSQVSPEIQQRIAEMERIKVRGKPIQSYWGEWKDYQNFAQKEAGRAMAKIIAVAVFTSVRDHALVEFLHREGQIPDKDYQTINAGITAQLDGLGINGLKRLFKVRPDLEERLKNDEREIEILDPRTSSSEIDRYKKVKRGEYYRKGLENKHPGEYGDQTLSPEARKEQALEYLRTDAMGRGYEKAEKKKDLVVSTSMVARGDNLNLDNRALFDAMNGKREALSKETALNLYLINNYLGAKDPRLAEYFKNAGTAPDDIFKRAKGIAIAGYAKGGYEPIFPAGKPVIEFSEGAVLTPLKDAATTSEPEADQKKTKASGDESPRKQRRLGNGSSGTSPEEKTKPPEDDKKHDKFVTAGKIGATTVLGVGVIHGLGNLLKSEKPEKDSEGNDKPPNKSKKFIYAIEAAAAIAGIVLVWKNPTVGTWFTKALQQRA